ncbi:hypothetical protein ACIP20_03620 [Marinilactibacillus psychrotolerans]|uniref:hypothetical protein n=1 Tax=Marinilactibacillus psychrotolerans TaxID=191770 RepID=UPI001866B474|nr:hypothetical protein [Marinilactibacillus psychrotolerans]
MLTLITNNNHHEESWCRLVAKNDKNKKSNVITKIIIWAMVITMAVPAIASLLGAIM